MSFKTKDPYYDHYFELSQAQLRSDYGRMTHLAMAIAGGPIAHGSGAERELAEVTARLRSVQLVAARRGFYL